MPRYSPLHWLEVVQKWTEAATAFKQHGAKAPVVHGNSVRLSLKKFRRLQTNRFLIFTYNSGGETLRVIWSHGKSYRSVHLTENVCLLTRYCSVPTKEVHRLP